MWHGCHKYSEGCKLCYVYRSDEKHGADSSIVYKTKNFDIPVRKKRDGGYFVPSNSLVWTCFTSDFLLSDADKWRADAWDMMRQRKDLHFLFITKRIERFEECKPVDWGDGWENVTICVTCENQKRADERLPIFKMLPIKNKVFIHEPLLGEIDISAYLDDSIQQVSVGGESGVGARECRYEWVQSLRRQCVEKNVAFEFRQTGANFVKDGVCYKVLRKYQHSQAKKAGLDFNPPYKQIRHKMSDGKKKLPLMTEKQLSFLEKLM